MSLDAKNATGNFDWKIPGPRIKLSLLLINFLYWIVDPYLE